MSGLAGVYRRDGATPSENELDQLDDALRPRGPDGAAEWLGESVGFCHRLLQSTPEATPGYLPLERNGLVVTADARLDNRKTLCETLDIPNTVPDGEILLAAYDRWGVRCPEHLLGAFAFAIWDGRNERMFMARDHMGVKPLAYADLGNLVVFASESAIVAQHDAVPLELDEQWIGEFLLGYFEDMERTVFAPVSRLPPAHYLVANNDGMSVERYWELEIDPSRAPDAEEACAEQFRTLFREAVRCRLRGANQGGSLLSGGLDSSSIACTAAELQSQPFHTFSAFSDAIPESDEREYIDAVLDDRNFEPHFVSLDGVSPLLDREQMLRRQGRPIRASNHYIHWELFRQANDAGVRVILDGLHGDTVLSTGLNRLSMLARNGQVLTLAREVDALARQTERGSRSNLLLRALTPYAPAPLRWGWRYVFDSDDEPDIELLDPEFVERVETAALFDADSASPNQPETHLQQLQSGLVPYTLEAADRTAVAFGTEARFPFLDKRLVEFSVSLPPGEKLKHGWPRYVLRNAMDCLPDAVRWRGDKGKYGQIVVHGLLNHEHNRVKDYLDGGIKPVAGFVDRSQFRAEWNQLVASECPQSDVWRVIALAEWLSEWEIIS